MKQLKSLGKIFFGKSPKKTFLRLVFFTVPITFILANWIFLPTKVRGISMEPTISDGTWLITATFRKPINYGEVVCIRMAGKNIAYLKRILGLPGDRIAFKQGKLIRNGEFVPEPYLKFPCNWEMPERKVPEGEIYVVGDNRKMPIGNHKQGMTKIYRVLGSPLFY